MIRRFNEEKPVEDRGYDVFDTNGSYLGYCVFYDDEWHVDDDSDISFYGNGTYFSDDHDDWLRMIIGLIDIQNKYNK